MHFVGYVRVSFVGGRAGESFRSPEDQATAIRRWAKAHGHKVTVLAPELDESGGREDRPILLQALAGIQSGKFDGLVAYDLSRIMRDTRALLDLVDRVMAVGGEVATVEGSIDWLTSMGRMFGTFKAAIDEQYRREKGEHFKRLNRSSAERAIWKFRQVPIGYKLAGERPCGLVPSSDAAKVRAAFAARLESPPVPLTDLAKRLGLTPSGIRGVLRNRVYLGEIKVGDNVNRNAHKSIIDQKTFDAVQAAASVRPARSPRQPSMLAGLVRCQSCGHVMTRRNANNGYGGTYGCPIYHSVGDCPAPAGVTAPTLEEYVEAQARAAIASLQFQTARRSDEGERLRAELATAESELAAYLEATSAAGLGVEQFIEGSRSRADRISAARNALDSHYTLAPLGGLFDSGEDFWDSLNVHEKNKLLRGLLDAVVVAPTGRGSKAAVAERVRLFAHGSLGDLTYRGGGKPLPIAALPFPGRDDERLIGVTGRKDLLGGAKN